MENQHSPPPSRFGPGRCSHCYITDPSYQNLPHYPQFSLIYPWAIQALCRRCHRDLFYCRFCKLRFSLSDTSQLSRHTAKVDHDALFSDAVALPGSLSPAEEFDVQDGPTFEDSSEAAFSPSLSSPPRPCYTQLKIASLRPADLHALLRSQRLEDPCDFVKFTKDPLCGFTAATPAQERRGRFLAAEHKEKGLGLVQLASLVFGDVCASSRTPMTLSWVLLSFILSTIFLETSHTLQTAFCFALSLISSKLSPDADPPIVVPANARQAQLYYLKYSQTERGTLSLLDAYNPNRPEPLSSGHVYLSLVTSIQSAHYLGHQLEPSFILDFTNSTVYQSTFLHSTTPRAFEMLRSLLCQIPTDNLPSTLTSENICECIICLPSPTRFAHPIGVYNLIFWSDSFEAFSTKQNRGSIWVLFCSVATPSSVSHSSQNSFNSGRNTFLVAVGPSGRTVSHECVWKRLLCDLKILNNIQTPLETYSRYHRQELLSVFPVYVFLQDTPERTDSNGLASWKSTNNVVYGHKAPIARISSKLPSCTACHLRRLAASPMPRSCDRCYDWDIPELVAITYKSLVDAANQTKSDFNSGLLPTRSSIVQALRGYGISPAIATDIASQLLSRTDPALPLSLPSLWSYGDIIEVNDSIEVVMHLLFLGIVRSVAKDVVFPFLSARKQWTSYVDRVKSLLQRIYKLGLYWLKVQPIGISGSFGGWVSENYLGYSRISKYLGALTDDLPTVDTPYTDPALPPSRMSLPQLQKWLLARGLRVSRPPGQPRARKADYLATVQATGWLRPGDPPAVLPNAKQGMPLSTFEHVIVSCHTMVCSIMSVRGIPTTEEADAILREIKLYLSYDHIFHTWKLSDAADLDGVAEPKRPKYSQNSSTDDLIGKYDVSLHYDVSKRTFTETTMPCDDESADDMSLPDEDVDLEDDTGSISEDSVGEPNLEEGAPPGAPEAPTLISEQRFPPLGPTTAAIPAVKKRNKINLLKVPAILRKVGSFHHCSELGPKGEGAIQTVKPIVRKLGGITKNNWALHVARGWSSRRHSRNAISLTVESMKEKQEKTNNLSAEEQTFLSKLSQAFTQSVSDVGNAPGSTAMSRNDIESILETDQEGWGDLLDAVCHGKDLPVKRMYGVFKSKAAASAALTSALDPLSVVIVQPSATATTTSPSPEFALVYKAVDKELRLLKVEPYELSARRCGCAFFRWRESVTDTQDVLMTQRSYQDYGLLLPLDATVSGETFPVYYLITYRWKEMASDGSICNYWYTR